MFEGGVKIEVFDGGSCVGCVVGFEGCGVLSICGELGGGDFVGVVDVVENYEVCVEFYCYDDLVEVFFKLGGWLIG